MDNSFEYNYSAPTQKERREVEYILSQYASPNSSRVERIKKLDKKVKRLPMVVAITLGVCGALMFGLGMSMVLEWNLLVAGSIVCGAGCLPMVVASFVYNKLYSYQKKKYGAEIIKLSSELLNGENKEYK